MNKNLAVGHGLCLVAGLPLPAAVTAAAAAAQARIEAAHPGAFIWYGGEHLHVTVRALLRTRYRAAPPLGRSELPADLAGILADLAAAAANSTPLPIRFLAPTITGDGHVQAAAEARPMSDWWTRLRGYGALDDEAERRAFHVSLGFAKPGVTVSERLVTPELPALGECAVDSLWLVHYANRTLNRIHGKARLALGQDNALTPAQLLAVLAICDDAPRGDSPR